MYVRRRAVSDFVVCLAGLLLAVWAASIAHAADPELLIAPFDEAAAKAAQQHWAKHLNRNVTESNSLEMKLALIPPGEFLMSSPENEEERGWDELQHRVRITKWFYMGVYDVTLGNFLKFCNSSGYKTKAETDGKGGWGVDAKGNFAGRKPEYTFRNWGFQQTNDHPVVNVSWNDAQAFCKWLSNKEGKKYRLPSEAEWEYACRAGTTTPFNFGSSLNGREANCDGDFPYGTKEKGPYLKGTTSVGSYKPNAFGLYDMHGNAWQWCQDWYDKDYFAKSPTDDPTGPSVGSLHVIRGGGWGNSALYCRSADRAGGAPAPRVNSMGFRVVCER